MPVGPLCVLFGEKSIQVPCPFFFLKILFILREGEREGEKHPLVASHTPPTGDLAYNSSMCPEWEPNWQRFGLRAGAQSTEPQQPGHLPIFTLGGVGDGGWGGVCVCVMSSSYFFGH